MRRLTARCYDPSWRYKPQWAYPTPDDARDEIFWLPFRFNVLADGRLHQYFPLQLDDDVPWTLHAIFCPVFAPGDFFGGNHPGLVRITDSNGNQLSQGAVLALGVAGDGVGASLFGSTAGFGFPFEPGIECAPGGALLFDFQLSTNSNQARFDHAQAGNILSFVAQVFGVTGNGYSITIANGGALAVAVVGTAVTVTINTGVSTYNDVVAAIAANAQAAALMLANVSAGSGLTVVTAFGPSLLAGAHAATNVAIAGTVMGSKRFRECL